MGHRDSLLVARQYTTRKCPYEMLTRSVCLLGFVQVRFYSFELVIPAKPVQENLLVVICKKT